MEGKIWKMLILLLKWQEQEYFICNKFRYKKVFNPSERTQRKYIELSIPESFYKCLKIKHDERETWTPEK